MNLKKLNVILVYNKSEDKILMCKRAKEPYKGKYNLVGGKVEKNENFFDLDKFAGEGNIGHMLQQAEIYKNNLL